MVILAGFIIVLLLFLHDVRFKDQITKKALVLLRPKTSVYLQWRIGTTRKSKHKHKDFYHLIFLLFSSGFQTRFRRQTKEEALILRHTCVDICVKWTLNQVV